MFFYNEVVDVSIDLNQQLTENYGLNSLNIVVYTVYVKQLKKG